MNNSNENDFFEELEKERRECVSINRRTGLWKGIADLLAHQYSKKTHFVYELLQNAEDALASEARFHLKDSCLAFSHNGQRMFSMQDIEAITNIAQSTKQDDYTQIGKHGIGFKAVFAYTHAPRIFSGEKSFEIEDVVIPRRLDQTDVPGDLSRDETRIVMPFDSEEIAEEYRFRKLIPAEKAVRDISPVLKKLGLRTLLFLNNIEEIYWRLPDGESGEFIRETKPCNVNIKDVSCRFIELYDGECSESWIVFSKECMVEEDGGRHACSVEIAFMIVNGKVVPAQNTELSVYFPTEKKTELGFLIQGPFKTTKARDNISLDSEANHQLIEEIAILAADSLEILRDLELLNVDSFLAFPLKGSVFKDENASFFAPVYRHVRNALQSKKLLPSNTGKFIHADNAKLARGEALTSLLSSEQLSCLFGAENMEWLNSSITESGRLSSFHEYLVGRKRLYPAGWEQEPLIMNVLVDAQNILPEFDDVFFKKQQLGWLIKFYLYVQEENSRKNLVRNKSVPCIPLESGKWVGAKNKTVVFYADGLPESCNSSVLLTCVKNEAGDRWEEVKIFLEFLGVHEFSKEDEVRHLLDKFYGVDSKLTVTLQEHMEHIQLFQVFWLENRQAAKALLSGITVFIVDSYPGVDLEGEGLDKTDSINSFLAGDRCYIDQPLKTTFLSDVLNLDGDDARQLLSHCYLDMGEPFIEFTVDLGVLASISPKKCLAEYNPLIEKKGRWGVVQHNSDYRLPSFIDELVHQDLSEDNFDKKFNAAHLIWNMMCSISSEYFMAHLQPNNNHETYSKAESILIQQLSEAAWLLDIDGNWKRPCDLTEEMLYTGATDDDPTPTFDISKVTNGWLKLVGFGQSEEMKTAFRNSGEDYDGYLRFKELMKQNPGELEKLLAAVEQDAVPGEVEELDIAECLDKSFNKPGKTELNDEYTVDDDPFAATVKNPEPREKKLDKKVRDRKDNEPPVSKRKRVRVSKTLECKDPQTKETIRQWYKGRCQICGETWPKRNGVAYFVVAYLVEHKKGRWIDDPGNTISLCAKHFAQWRHASKQLYSDIPKWAIAQKTSSEGGGFPVKLEIELLGKREEIKYREDHFLALRSLITSEDTGSVYPE
jgi:hypothetical protein